LAERTTRTGRPFWQDVSSALFILSNVWSNDCTLLTRLFPERSRPPLPVYRNHSPSSRSSSYLRQPEGRYGQPIGLRQQEGRCAADIGLHQPPRRPENGSTPAHAITRSQRVVTHTTEEPGLGACVRCAAAAEQHPPQTADAARPVTARTARDRVPCPARQLCRTRIDARACAAGKGERSNGPQAYHTLRERGARPPDSTTDCAPCPDCPAMPATCGKCAPHCRQSRRSFQCSPTRTPCGGQARAVRLLLRSTRLCATGAPAMPRCLPHARMVSRDMHAHGSAT